MTIDFEKIYNILTSIVTKPTHYRVSKGDELSKEDFVKLFDFSLLEISLEKYTTFTSVKIKSKQIKCSIGFGWYNRSDIRKTVIKYVTFKTFVKHWIVQIVKTAYSLNKNLLKEFNLKLKKSIKEILNLIPKEYQENIENTIKNLESEFYKTEEQLINDFQNQMVNHFVNRLSSELKDIPLTSAKIIVKKVIDKLLLDRYYT
jgi:hypothetical protein